MDRPHDDTTCATVCITSEAERVDTGSPGAPPCVHVLGGASRHVVEGTSVNVWDLDDRNSNRSCVIAFLITQTMFTFTFRAFSRLFYPKRLTITAFVRRKRNKNISLSVCRAKWQALTINIMGNPFPVYNKDS